MPSLSKMERFLFLGKAKTVGMPVFLVNGDNDQADGKFSLLPALPSPTRNDVTAAVFRYGIKGEKHRSPKLTQARPETDALVWPH